MPQISAPISLAEYRQRVEQALEAVDGARMRSERQPVDAGKAILPGGERVQLPSGDVVQVQSPLAGEDLGWWVALDRLRALQSQLALAEKDDARNRLARLDAVLARPEFAGATYGLGERVWLWIRELLRRIFPGGAGDGSLAWEGAAAAFAWIVVIAGGILVISLLSYWLARLLRAMVADSEARGREDGAGGLPLTARAAREQAASLGLAGNYRQAVRLLYLSLLLRLEEQGLVQGGRRLTNREVLQRVAPAIPAAGRALEPVVQTFDRVWYGMREPDLTVYQQYEADVDRASGMIAGREAEGGQGEVSDV